MPVKLCGVCSTRYELPTKQARYVHPNELFVCSIRCIETWVCARDAQSYLPEDPLMWRKKYPYPGGLSDAVHAFWSRYYKRWFASKYEIQVARWLDNRNFTWRYEEIGFPLGRGRYTPDFYLPRWDCFLEVKGAWMAGKKKKMDRFRSDYPDISLLIIPWLLASSFDPIPEGDELFHSGT